MSIENKNSYRPAEQNEKPKKRTQIAVRYIGGAATIIALGTGLNHLASGPEMSGNQTIRIEPGDTVDNLVNEHVEGGASHTGAVRTEVINSPANTDVFENGQLDPGEELELPEKVQ